MYLLRVVLKPLPMWNFRVQRGMVCSSKLTSASSLRSNCQGQVRRQKASTSCQDRFRRQPPTVCRDGQCRPPHRRAKPASSILPITKEKTLVNRPCRKEPYSSAKHSSAMANQSKAVGIKRNAPAYCVRVEKKGEAAARVGSAVPFRRGAARRADDRCWGGERWPRRAWLDRGRTSCKSGARPPWRRAHQRCAR